MLGREEAAAVLKGGFRIVVASKRIGAAAYFDDDARPIGPADVACIVLGHARIRICIPITPTDFGHFRRTIDHHPEVQVFLADAAVVAAAHAFFERGIEGGAVVNRANGGATSADFGAIAVEVGVTQDGVTRPEIQAGHIFARVHCHVVWRDGECGCGPRLVATLIFCIETYRNRHGLGAIKEGDGVEIVAITHSTACIEGCTACAGRRPGEHGAFRFKRI